MRGLSSRRVEGKLFVLPYPGPGLRQSWASPQHSPVGPSSGEHSTAREVCGELLAEPSGRLQASPLSSLISSSPTPATQSQSKALTIHFLGPASASPPFTGRALLSQHSGPLGAEQWLGEDRTWPRVTPARGPCAPIPPEAPPAPGWSPEPAGRLQLN